ncbi:UbiA family prenyltransferase [Chloroflexota bacterium]
MLTFIGICAAIVAGNGQPPVALLFLAGVAILFFSAGANGLTNYFDRDIDARMQRTKNRALPSRRIYPPEKVLPLTIGLVVISLVLAWWLHPLCFASNLIGTIAAITWRKRATCVFPQGVIASCAPILIGWFAISPVFEWELLLICILIAIWLPLHVWSLMIANREDYLSAKLCYFPMSWEIRQSKKVLLVLGLLLYISSIALHFIGDFTWLYLVVANVLGIIVVYSSWRLIVSHTPRDAWRLYKLTAFPYLGIIFLVMCLDIWLFG